MKTIGGKSGQQRAPHFLTGRYPRGYCSVTENNRPACRIRVKRWGKSPPVLQATVAAVRHVGCKTMYIPVPFGYRAARPDGNSREG